MSNNNSDSDSDYEGFPKGHDLSDPETFKKKLIDYIDSTDPKSDEEKHEDREKSDLKKYHEDPEKSDETRDGDEDRDSEEHEDEEEEEEEDEYGWPRTGDEEHNYMNFSKEELESHLQHREVNPSTMARSMEYFEDSIEVWTESLDLKFSSDEVEENRDFFFEKLDQIFEAFHQIDRRWSKLGESKGFSHTISKRRRKELRSLPIDGFKDYLINLLEVEASDYIRDLNKFINFPLSSSREEELKELRYAINYYGIQVNISNDFPRSGEDEDYYPKLSKEELKAGLNNALNPSTMAKTMEYFKKSIAVLIAHFSNPNWAGRDRDLIDKLKAVIEAFHQVNRRWCKVGKAKGFSHSLSYSKLYDLRANDELRDYLLNLLKTEVTDYLRRLKKFIKFPLSPSREEELEELRYAINYYGLPLGPATVHSSDEDDDDKDDDILEDEEDDDMSEDDDMEEDEDDDDDDDMAEEDTGDDESGDSGDA